MSTQPDSRYTRNNRFGNQPPRRPTYQGNRGGGGPRRRGPPPKPVPLSSSARKEVDEAQKQARFWQGCGEYHWSADWESYARVLQSWYAFPQNQHGSEPPKSPTNDSARQMTNNTKYKRPAMYQGARV